MNAKFLCVLVTLLLLGSASARVYTYIDTFDLPSALLFVDIANGDDPPTAYTWYSPYNMANPPTALFQSAAGALGGQRDIIVGYLTVSYEDIISVVINPPDQNNPGLVDISFPLGVSGGIYLQWDGADTPDGSTDGGVPAFPGVTLNSSPGIGSGGNPFGLSGGRMDFTFGGRATYISCTVSTDHTVTYVFNARDVQGRLNEAQTTIIADGDTIVKFFVAFNSAGWDLGANFDWTQVVAFQVKVLTASRADLSTSTAIDTSFYELGIIGYEISGSVITDCLCDTTADGFASGVSMELRNGLNQQLIRTTLTDASGNFIFTGDLEGTYSVCLPTASNRCPQTPQCRTVTLTNLDDPAPLSFSLTVTSTMTIPQTATLECGDCSTPTCTGFASLTGCSGTQTITTWTDSTAGNSCRQTISRTWTNPETNQRQTQSIILVDTLPPVITQAGSLNFACNSIGTPYATWLSTNAGSTATDCSVPVTYTNDANTNPIGNCGSRTVTFTATDRCGLTTRTTATYTVTDGVSPAFSPQASDASAPCNLKNGSDQSALTQWVNTRGGATATDNCGSVTYSNNFVSLASGCDNSATVTFTATDSCGAAARTTATFRIFDSAAPSITAQANPLTVQCTSGSGAQTQFNNWLTTRGGATATDNCIANDNNLVWTNDNSGTPSNGCSQPITVTFTVTDPCGLTARTTSTFTVSDNTSPTLTTPAAALTVACSDDITTRFNTWVNTNGGAAATDACTQVVWSNNAGSAPAAGCNNAVTVTFAATDSCNNAAVRTTATFTVRDLVAPSFSTPPSNSGAECNSGAVASFNSWLSGNAGAVGTDACSPPVSITNDFPNGGSPTLGCNAVTTVRFTARDNCGNSSGPQTATFTISDTTAPVINPVASPSGAECSANTNQAYNTWRTDNAGARATDVCGTVTWSNNGPSSLPAISGCSVAQSVTFTVTDTCGNRAQTTATYTVSDSTAPVISVQAANRDLECSPSNSGETPADLTAWLNSRGGAQATDNCGPVTWTNNFVALSSGCVRSSTVTFVATDPCGLTARTTATFTIRDTSGPAISPAAQSQTVQCDPATNDNAFDAFVANHGGAVASDLCQSSQSLVWTNSQVEAPVGCDSEIVTFTVTDACGLSARTTATFTIIDSAIPQFTTPPSSLSVECNGSGNQNDYATWVATFGGAVATDSCAFSIVLSSNAPTTGPVGCGSVPVVFRATDECNNSATRTATFTVVDTSAPVVNPAASPLAVQCDPSNNQGQLQSWLASRGGALASDVCYSSESLVWTNNFASLVSDGCTQRATVTFTVTDPCAQRARTTATFSIIDTLSPQITNPARNDVIECNSSTNTQTISAYIASRGGATATDGCSAVTWTNNFLNAPNPCGTPLSITFTASDACGNTAPSTGSLQIVDTTQPRFVNFPGDARVGCDQATDSSVTGVPTIGDDCSAVANLILDSSDVSFEQPADGLCPGDIIITRTWTLVDECGNTNTRDQMVVQVIARSTGQCTPSQCPPCAEVQCCTEIDDIECIPVNCSPVGCIPVGCQPVPCIPQNCGIPSPTGNPQGPIPLPSVIPAPSCEPVYIYVFDDDEANLYSSVPRYESSASSKMAISLISLLLVVLFALF